MPVPTSINDLSINAIENSPQGTEPAKGTIDDYFRSHASFIAGLRDGSAKFLQAGTGVIARTAQDKLRESVSLNDFDGATPDAKFANAKMNGAKSLRITAGTYNTSGWRINEGEALEAITFDPGAQLVVASSASAIGIDIQRHKFTLMAPNIVAAGSAVGMIGIRAGDPVAGGKSNIYIGDGYNVSGFSERGIVAYQPVFIGTGRGVIQGCKYGFSVEPANGVGGSTVAFGPSYISGCTRGVNLEMCSWATLHETIVEYCGSSVTSDGALHFKGCGTVTVVDRYGEQNARNMVKEDSGITFLNGSMFAATAPDVVTYVGAAFSDRGSAQITSRSINIRRIGADTIDNEPLLIGSNLSVGLDDTVTFGNMTTEALSGTLPNAAWATVKAIPAGEMTGGNHQKAMYEYVAYAGFADLSTGFDSGTVMNGVLRSYSGATPAWLRMSGSDVQMNVTSSSYGLNYKIVLRRVFPGA